MRDRFISTLCSLAEQDSKITLITGDLGFGVLDQFRARFPRQFINAGVAEQNMTLVATGMALEGHTVFTYSIANFPTLRCLEMIRNDAAYHDANVKIVAIGGGFSYGALGMSHHATEDLAVLRSIPGISTFAPSSLREVEEVTKASVRIPGTCYLRLDKDTGPDGPIDDVFVVGRPRLIRKGRDVAIFTTGGILSETVEAAERLSRSGVNVSIYSVHTLKPIDEEAVVTAAQAHPMVVTVEEHTINGGLGGVILEVLADREALPARFLRIGLEDRFSSIVGSQRFLRSAYQLDAASIAGRILVALKHRRNAEAAL